MQPNVLFQFPYCRVLGYGAEWRIGEAQMLDDPILLCLGFRLLGWPPRRGADLFDNRPRAGRSSQRDCSVRCGFWCRDCLIGAPGLDHFTRRPGSPL
jgi:hypothetical protein